MRVGVFIGDALPEAGGGFTFVQEILDQLRRSARRSSHQFIVLTTRQAQPPDGGLEMLSLHAAGPSLAARARRRVAREVSRFFERPLAPPAVEPRTDRLLHDAGVDVVWYVQPAVSWTFNLPYITTVWDLQHRLQPYFPEVSGNGGFEAREATYGRLLRRAALVITGTETGSKEIQHFFGVAPERIRILPHPTPSFALQASSTRPGVRPDVAPSGPFLFYPAQLWPHKNHVNLLHALRLLRDRGLDYSLVLAGSDKGNASHILQTAAHLNLSEAVKMLGFVSRADLIGLYQHAFALSYVSYFGPENLPPLEAFALGCPVIASEVAGAREQLGSAALFVNPSRPQEMADAIGSLSSDPSLRAALIERGAARARHFTGEEFLSGVLTWLDEFEHVRRCWPSGVH